MAVFFFFGVEKNVEKKKEKMLVTSIFSFLTMFSECVFPMVIKIHEFVRGKIKWAILYEKDSTMLLEKVLFHISMCNPCSLTLYQTTNFKTLSNFWKKYYSTSACAIHAV